MKSACTHRVGGESLLGFGDPAGTDSGPPLDPVLGYAQSLLDRRVRDDLGPEG